MSPKITHKFPRSRWKWRNVTDGRFIQVEWRWIADHTEHDNEGRWK